MTLSHLPAVRFLAAYAAGCAAAFVLSDIVLPLCVIAATGICLAGWMRSYSPLFWVALIAMGMCGVDSARGLPARVEGGMASDIPAITRGRIESIVGRVSSVVRCLVRGTVDTRPMEARHNTRFMLSVIRPDTTAQRFLQPGNSIVASARVRLPRPATLPGEFSESVYYSSLGVEWLGTATGGTVALVEPGTTVSSVVERVAGAISAEITALFPERSRGMAIALATGDRSHLAQATREVFTLTGTTHVLAVSGLHVGILSAIILLPLARLRCFALRLAIFAPVLLAYTMLTGMQPSMIRAAIMAVLFLVIAGAQREANLLNILCFTTVVMLACDPHLLFSAGFHLSVAALAGIAVLYPATERMLALFLQSQRPAVRFVRLSMAATFAASAAVSPIVALSFSVYSVLSPLANLCVIPLASLGMVYTLCACVAAQIAGWCGESFACTADALFFLAEWLNTQIAALPVAAITGRYAFVVALCSTAATLYIVRSQKKRTVVFRSVVSVAGTVLLSILVTGFHPQIEVLSRPQLVAVIAPVSAGRSLVLLQDRRADSHPRRDIGLEKYIDGKSDTTTIIACGAASMRCASSLRRTTIDAVIAQSLHFKNRGLWVALDSLDGRNVRILNASHWLTNKRPVVLTGKGVVLCWDAWRNSVSLRSRAECCHLILPRVVVPMTFSVAE